MPLPNNKWLARVLAAIERLNSASAPARAQLYGDSGDGTIYPVKVDPEPSGVGALAVNIQDQVTSPFITRLHTHLQDGISFAVAPSIGDWDVTLSAGHGCGAGCHLYILEGSNYQYVQAVGVVGNVVTLDAMIDYPYTVAGATISRVSDSLKVNGAVARQIFHAYPPPGRVYDVTGIRFTITCAAVPDDGVFGDIASLLRGVNVHVLVAEGALFSFGTFHNNGDFARAAGGVTYTDKGPGGTNGVNVDGKIREQWGVAVRLRGGALAIPPYVYARDEIRLVVQDNLTTLNSFQAAIYGHVVQ